MKKTTPKAVIDRLVERYTPHGVVVTWRTDGEWRPAGANHYDAKNGYIKRTLLTPYPDTPWKALVFLHECAHFAIADVREPKAPTHCEEFFAERTAMEWWRIEGHCVPGEYLAEAKRYIRECIVSDRKRKHKIVPHIARWAKK